MTSYQPTINYTTGLYQPKGMLLKETFYMDTEAEVEWELVQGATFYMLIVRLSDDNIFEERKEKEHQQYWFYKFEI